MNSLARSMAKRATVAVFGSDPALGIKLSWIARTGALTILNFHRVDDDRSSAYEGMAPKIFDELVGWLKGQFEIVTFAELESTHHTKRPKLILSFDDGYKDFITTVVPILESHRVRANQNIIPASVESGLPPLNVMLQDFIGQAPDSLLRETPLPGFENASDRDAFTQDRVTAGRRASAALKRMPIAQQKAAMAALRPSFERFDGWRTTPLMTLEDLRQISAVHEIGAHSMEHATMAAETDDYVANDARECQHWFDRSLGLAPRVYAFPNGSLRPGHAEIVAAAGFDHILLVGEHFSHLDATEHGRITMYGHSMAEVRFRATGALARPTARGGTNGRSTE